MMKDITKLALEAKWDEVLHDLKNSSPHKYDELCVILICDYHNGEYPDDLHDWGMTDEQIKLFRWLGSGERRVEYYNQLSDEEMTAEDWVDLKASAW